MPADLVVVEFDRATQSLSALRAVAYRLIGTATCQIEEVQDRWVCSLESVGTQKRGDPFDRESVRIQFLNMVADENMRESIATRTEPVRNLILALAFGAVAANKPKMRTEEDSSG